jgi:transposase InsO family protein
VKFACIQAEKAEFPVTVLCRVLGVSRAGFYGAQTRPVSPRATQDVRLATEITAIHAESRRCYGSPRVHAELRARGHCTSRKRVARLMRRAGLVARRRRAFRVTTQSRPRGPLAPNHLARQFTAPAPNRVWVTDITYLPTAEGWVYLAAVLDLFSRRVIGWATSARLAEGLTLEALTMGLARRRPPPGLLHHSDRGAHYASEEYRTLLARHGLRRSMSGAGACWDNAVAESFFATLKVELAHDVTWPSRAAARRALFEYIEVFYNGERRHSTLGHLSPVAFERQWHQRTAQ